MMVVQLSAKQNTGPGSGTYKKSAESTFLQKAMEDLGFSGEEINEIFRIISAVLKLGNIQFVPTTNMDGTEGCAITNDYGKEKKKSKAKLHQMVGKEFLARIQTFFLLRSALCLSL